MELGKTQDVYVENLSHLDALLDDSKKSAYAVLQGDNIAEAKDIIDKKIMREKEFYAYVYNAIVSLIIKHGSADDMVVLFDVDYTLADGDGPRDQANVLRPAFGTIIASLQALYPALRFGIMSGRDQESITILAQTNIAFDKHFVFSSREYSRDRVLDQKWYSENSIDDHVQKVHAYVDVSSKNPSIYSLLVDDGIEAVFAEKGVGVPIPRELCYTGIAV